MKPKANRIFILLASSPMLIGMLIFFNLKFNSGCNGLFEALASIIILITLGLVGLITITVQIIRIFDRRDWKFRLTTIGLVLVSGISVVWSTNKPNDYFKSDIILEAEFYNTIEGSLKLREDGTYSARIKEVDWSCAYEGEYTGLGNLLILSSELVSQTDSLFAEKYLLKEPFLIPELEYLTRTDSSHWLRIIKN